MTVASLNARLLARKGDARPAPIDTGEGRAYPMSARSFAGSWPASAVWPEEPQTGDPRSRARVSLRLDDARHRRLRIAAIHLDASLQQILTQALDQYLAQIAPDCPCMGRGAMPGEGETCQDVDQKQGGAA
jgi:hypothetical protein